MSNMLQQIASWLRERQRGIVPLCLMFFSLAAFFVASSQFDRQLATWNYAHNPDSYSLVDYKITSARRVKVQRQKHKNTERYVKGFIRNREVETIIDRTALPRDIFDQLEGNVIREYSTKVLYASQFDKHDTKRPSTHSFHVVEPGILGTTPSQAMLDIAAWNFAWLVGIFAAIARVWYERRVYQRELAACMAENQ